MKIKKGLAVILALAMVITLVPTMAFATTNLLGNIMAQPDFVAYKFEDKKNWAPRLCRKLYGAQGVYWTIRSKEDLETAEREGAIAIFERFIP